MRILNRFQIRDLELERLIWAMKLEMEMGGPSGHLYLDGLTLALASRLVSRHSSRTKEAGQRRGGLTGYRLKQVLSFIEDQLAEDLSLEKIAAIAQVSPSHLNALFRHSMGMAMHQYVIQRRVELAKTLLLRDDLSMARRARTTPCTTSLHCAGPDEYGLDGNAGRPGDFASYACVDAGRTARQAECGDSRLGS